MSPYDWWLKMYGIWMELVFEVNALRNCHSQNRSRIELIEKALRENNKC